RVTAKGRTILGVVSLLRDPGVRVPLALVLAVVTVAAYGADRWLAPATGIEALYTTAGGETRAIDPVASRGVVQLLHPEIAGGPFSARWRGFLAAPRSGAYAFRVISDGPATLFVDGRTVAQQAAGPGETQGEVALRGGVHAILIRYVHDRGD